MDDDHDIVITSDEEELLELVANGDVDESQWTSRKRQKLSHDSLQFSIASIPNSARNSSPTFYRASSLFSPGPSSTDYEPEVSNDEERKITTLDGSAFEGSQDPLLLSEQKSIPAEAESTSLPSLSPTKILSFSLSQDPLYMSDSPQNQSCVHSPGQGDIKLTASPTHLSPSARKLVVSPSRDQAIPAPAEDDLLQFENSAQLSSPLSSPGSSQHNFFQSPRRSPSPIVRQVASPQRHPALAFAAPAEDLYIAQALQDSEVNHSRYQLRKRGLQQEKPYSYDKLQYTRMMQHNPDAIVKFRSPNRGDRHHRRDDQYEEEESQDKEPDQYSSPSTESRNARAPNSANRSPHHDAFNGFLPEMSSEDEPEGVADLRKQARALERKERKERREQEERERRQKTKKPKTFPLESKSGSNYTRTHSPHRAVTSATRMSVYHVDSSPAQLRQDDLSGSTHHREIDSTTSQERMSTFDFDLSSTQTRHRSPTPGSSKSSASRSPLRLHSPSNHSEMNEATLWSPDFPDDPQPIANDSQSTDVNMAPPPDSDQEPSINAETQAKTRSWPKTGRQEKQLERASKVRRKEARYRKALNYMAPAFMIPMLLAGEGRSSKKARSELHRGSKGHDGPLLPGQTYTRKVPTPIPQEIKGGNSSSEDEGSEVRQVPTLRRPSPGWHEDSNDLAYFSGPEKTQSPPRLPDKDVIELTDSSSDEEVSDLAIETYLAEEEHEAVEVDGLIDFMLMKPPNPKRSATSSAKNKSHRDSKRHPRNAVNGQKRPSHKINVTVGEARRVGNERQTTLPFQPKAAKSYRKGFKPRSTSGHFSSEHGRLQRNDTARGSDSEEDSKLQQIKPPKAKKQKEKERRERKEANGIYLIDSDTIRIRHGLHQSARTLEGPLADDHLILVDAQSRQRGLSSSRSTTPLSVPDFEQVVDAGVDSTALYDDEAPVVDMTPLTSGISIDRRTYIGRGQLFDLLHASESPTAPISVSTQGFSLGPMTTLSQFESLLPKLCESLLQFATDLPDADDTGAHDWEYLVEATCQSLSWHLSNTQDERKVSLRNRVQDEITKMTARMREAAIPSSSMDATTLIVCRFCVELSIRAGFSLPSIDARSNASIQGAPLVESTRLLVHYLLEYGIGQLDNPIHVPNASGNLIGTEQLTAELWIFLIHVINHDVSKNTSSNGHLKLCHPLWKIVQDTLESRLQTSVGRMSASGVVWQIVFGLSRLSQFSVHGTTTDNIRLPSSWTLVSLALDQTILKLDSCLRADEHNDHEVANVFVRCFNLFCNFHWDLGDAFAIIKRLRDEVFISRNLGDLQHERPGLPRFIQRHDWSLCSEYDPDDSAHGLFLKLVVNAVDAVIEKGETSSLPPRAKKLLSLVAPIASVNFSDRDPKYHQLSMLYNRFATIAVCIKKNPDQQISRMKQARNYVDFRNADHVTRRVYIQCLMVLSQMMVLGKLGLSETLTWLAETADILIDELPSHNNERRPAIKKSPQHRSLNTTLLSINLLITATRHIIGAYAEIGDYPEPALIGRIEKFFKHDFLPFHAPTSRRLNDLVQCFLHVRSKIVPPPHRPSIESDAQESQDDYEELNINLDDPELNEALNPTRAKDSEVSKPLEQISWSLYRLFTNSFKQPLPQEKEKRKRIMSHVEKMIETWLGCASIIIQHTSWASYLKLRGLSWNEIQDPQWKRRIDIYIMYNILKLQPTSIEPLKQKFFKALFIALVPEKDDSTEDNTSDLSSQYVSLLLSVDGLRHSLLRGLDLEAYRGAEGDFCFELKSHRPILLRGIINNMVSSLQEDEKANEMYVGWCIEMLSTMREIYQSFGDYSSAHHQYQQLCREVLHIILEEQPRLRSLSRMTHWEAWSRSLDP
ncbi:hypothetical protein K435DRAFT_844524 [Dendrothele bispora CBS 962.96]|uniref:Protein mms22 n=1 Tax=Dendrothele bispora (strain CBS 962.96) TaxID=1314807 RepID=A0A4S8L0W0_DENBC|nr:hypothetical protein K435DRAFT_844524 [Dendrothele bispora CBS 962.96]